MKEDNINELVRYSKDLYDQVNILPPSSIDSIRVIVNEIERVQSTIRDIISRRN